LALGDTADTAWTEAIARISAKRVTVYVSRVALSTDETHDPWPSRGAPSRLFFAMGITFARVDVVDLGAGREDAERAASPRDRRAAARIPRARRGVHRG